MNYSPMRRRAEECAGRASSAPGRDSGAALASAAMAYAILDLADALRPPPLAVSVTVDGQAIDTAVKGAVDQHASFTRRTT